MMGIASLRAFARDESGAVTVDWVVLTAALVGLAVGVLTVVRPPMEELVVEIADHLATDHIRTEF